MEDLLIDLTKNAEWTRLLPFPNQYRLTTGIDEPHTQAEYDNFMAALESKAPDAIAYATTINLDITQHNTNSINPNTTEFEFQYHYLDNYKKNLKYPTRWYLFHGSRIGNWHSILRSGIKNMSGTRFMSAGQALGPGVYATTDIRIASDYGRSIRQHTYIAVLELLVDPAVYHKGNGIYVIPDDKLLFPRYLLMLGTIPKYDGQDLLTFYKKLRDGLIKPNTKAKRLAIDIKNISDYYLEELNPNCILLYINEALFRCYVFSYPFKPPVLQLCSILNPDHSKYAEHSKHFDADGCYVSYPYSEWVMPNTILDVIKHLQTTLSNNPISQKKEEYSML